MEELILIEMLNESYKRLIKTVLEGGDFSALEDILKRDLDAIGRTMLERVVSDMDEALLGSEERKKYWTAKRTRERSIKTVFGNVLLKRKYFQHKRTGRYVHLADVYLKIDKHQRISEMVKHGLVMRVCEVSYAKSADVAGLTAQTTSNVLKQLKEEELKQYPVPEHKYRTETIFVCADEDHIAIREKGSQQQYLVYVYDGIAGESSRHTLQNVRYFTQKQKGSSEELWLEVAQYIYDVYDIDCLKTIYIMGDGAAWIKQGVAWLPKAVFVLDKWHMTKYISSACALFADGERGLFSKTLWRSIRSGDKGLFSATVRQMKQFAPEEKQCAKIEPMRAYIMNHWEGIQNQARVTHGCSAEGHVSHVLSARLSSRPMVWSAEGAHRMALLRTYRANGGNVSSLHLKSDKQGERNIVNLGRIRKTLDKKMMRQYGGKQVTIPILHSSVEEELKNMINSIFRDSLM